MDARYFGFSRPAQAIAELDGLRALAVLLVVGRHAVWPFYQQTGNLVPIGGWDLALPLVNGWIGVDLFFVLSGFLITLHLLRRGGGVSDFSHYLGARALRIVPAYVAVLVLVIAGAIPLYEVAPQGLTVRVIYHLLFLQDYLPANIVVAYWSLGVEEKFYLIAPVVVLAAVRCADAKRRYLYLGGLILLPTVLRVVTALQHPGLTDYETFFPTFRSPFHLTFDGLAIGVACAFVFRDQAANTPSRWAVPLFRLSAAALVWQLFAGELLGDIGWYEKTAQPLVLSLTFGGLLLGAACGGSRGGILTSQPMLVVARVSYPLYLIHMTLVASAAALAGYALGGGVASLVWYLAVYLSLSLGAALILHYAVEKPFLLVKEQLAVGSPRLAS